MLKLQTGNKLQASQLKSPDSHCERIYEAWGTIPMVSLCGNAKHLDLQPAENRRADSFSSKSIRINDVELYREKGFVKIGFLNLLQTL